MADFLSTHSEKDPLVDSACAVFAGYLVSGAADARVLSFVQEPQSVSTSICFMAPLSKFLDLLPPAPLPTVKKRDAQAFATQGGTRRLIKAGEKVYESFGH